MTLEATSNPVLVPKTAEGPIIHPRWVRVTHWVNVLAMFMMIGSGWQIYDASPLFRFLYFPHEIALGEWLAGALLVIERAAARPFGAVLAHDVELLGREQLLPLRLGMRHGIVLGVRLRAHGAPVR